MKSYTVEYKMLACGEVKSISLLAHNKEEAWDKATFESIPKEERCTPYSSWVSSVTHQNGNYREFNTFEGKPY